MDSRVWGEKYISNPFPYISEDITKFKEADLKYYKKTFYINLKKYQAFWDQVVMKEAYDLLDEPRKKM